MNLTRKRIYTTLIILLLLGCIFYLHESIKAEVDYMFYSYDIINSEFRLNRIQNRKLNKIQEQFVEASVTKYGWTGYRMANMEYPYVGAVAVSDRSIPLGAKVVLDGVKYTVKDFTALWVWEKHGLVIDIYSEDSKNEMLVFGRQDKIVRLIY